MANEKVKIDLEVGGLDQLEASIGNVRALKRELRGFEAGTQEFQQITTTINEMNKEIKSSKLGAESFTEVLGKIPGPVGEIGDKVSGTVGILRLFSGVKLDDLKNSFSVLGGEVSSIFKGFGQLTGITKAYTFLNEGLSKSFIAVGVGEEAAATGAAALSAALIATGIGALVVGLTLAYEGLKEFVTGEEAAKRATEEANKAIADQAELLNLDLADAARRQKKYLSELKASGADEKTIREQGVKDLKENLKINQAALEENADLQNKIMKDGNGDLKKAQEDGLKLEQKIKDLKADIYVANNNNIADANKEAEKLEKERAQKSKAASDKELAERKQIQTEINKIVQEGYQSTLDERDKEIYSAGMKFNELLDKAKRHNINTNALEEAHRMELISITAKYDKKDKDEADKKAKEDLDKEKKRLKDLFELQKSELELQHSKGYLDEKSYIDKLYKLKVKYAENQVDLNNAEIERIKALDEEEKKQLDNYKKYADTEKAINKEIAASWVQLGQNIGNSFSELANLFEKGSTASKAFGVISVIINAAAAIGKVNMDFAEGISTQSKLIAKATATVEEGILLTADPFTAPQGIAMIAAGTSVGGAASGQLGLLNANKALQLASIGLTSGAQIAAILSASPSSGASHASSGGGGTSGAPAMQAPSYSSAAGAGMATPQIQAANGQNPATQIGQSIMNSQANPMRAYVVSSDITNAQSLQRRVNKGATFGLG